MKNSSVLDLEAYIKELEHELDEMTRALSDAWGQLAQLLDAQKEPISEDWTNVQPFLRSIMAAADASFGVVIFEMDDETTKFLPIPFNNFVLEDFLPLLTEFKKIHTSRQIDNVISQNGHITKWLMAPIWVTDKFHGVIGIGVHSFHENFTALDARILERMVEQFSNQIIKIKFVESQAQVAHLEHELTVAARIQRTLLPTTLPDLRNVEVMEYWLPSEIVGGDAWGWVIQPSGDLAMFMLDIAGKGLPAALASLSLHAEVRTLLSIGWSPVDVVQRVNQMVYETYVNVQLIAMLNIVTVDPLTGKVTQANAGHTRSLIRIQDQWQLWGATAPPIGVMPRIQVEAQTAVFAPQDIFLTYSDGFTELPTKNGYWGEDGLFNAVNKPWNYTLRNCIEAIFAEIAQVYDGVTECDDQTIIGFALR